jgi:hypothetical protein
MALINIRLFKADSDPHKIDPNLQYWPLQGSFVSLHGSSVNLHSSQLMTLTRVRIRLFTLLRS